MMHQRQGGRPPPGPPLRVLVRVIPSGPKATRGRPGDNHKSEEEEQLDGERCQRKPPPQDDAVSGEGRCEKQQDLYQRQDRRNFDQAVIPPAHPARRRTLDFRRHLPTVLLVQFPSRRHTVPSSGDR